MSTQLQGVYTALATPFDTTGTRIDEGALRRLLDRTIEAGIDGIVPCGSTGEFSTLSPAERDRLVEVVSEHTAGRVPVVPQTGALSTAEVVRLSQSAQSRGAAAVMVVAPFYEPLTVDETFAFYRDVAASIDIPIMAYNLPAATGVDLNPDLMAELVDRVPNVKYVKDTSGDFTTAARLIHNLGDSVSVFVGWDALFLAALLEGAAGSVIGAANVVPCELVQIHRAVQRGDLDDAKRTWDHVFPLMETFVTGGSYNAGIKAGMELAGVDGSSTLRAPGLPADVPRRQRLAQALKHLESA